MLKKKGVRQHFVLGGDGTQKGAPVLRLRGVSISGDGQSVGIYPLVMTNMAIENGHL